MGILSWIILGLLAGALAKFIMPGKDPGGCLITMVLGIIGAFVVGFIGTRLGWGDVQQFDLRGLGLAILGALIVLLIYRMATGKKD